MQLNSAMQKKSHFLQVKLGKLVRWTALQKGLVNALWGLRQALGAHTGNVG